MDSHYLLNKPKLHGMECQCQPPPWPSSCLLFNLPSHFQPILPCSILCTNFPATGNPLKSKEHAILFHVSWLWPIMFSCLKCPIPLFLRGDTLTNAQNQCILWCRWRLSQSPKLTILSMVVPLCLVHALLSLPTVLSQELCALLILNESVLSLKAGVSLTILTAQYQQGAGLKNLWAYWQRKEAIIVALPCTSEVTWVCYLTSLSVGFSLL